MRHRSFARVFLAACLVAAPVRLLPAQAAPAYEADPKFVKQMKDAKASEKQGDYLYAVDAYKKANKIAGGQCMPCLQSAYDLDMKLGNFKDAVGLSEQILALAATPRDKSVTEMNEAVAMLRMAGDTPKPDKLEPVHALLQAAMKDDPNNLSAGFYDGGVLARMGRLDDAAREFSVYAAQASADDPSRSRAQLFAKDPKLSLEPLAPPFLVTALDGSTFSLDGMRGKVVLIDFWATWNAPSREELSEIRKIVNAFAGQPLVVLTVSWDQDDIGWRAYVAKNDMKWLQYRDADHKLTGLFGVKWVPEYYIVDSNGVLLPGKLTDGSSVAGKLKPLIERANAAGKSTASVK
jgi:thioredoxin-like negative regulator of GroEL